MKKEKIEIMLDDLKVTNEGAYFLHQASGWARFLAIVGFIAYGLLILFLLITAIAAPKTATHHTMQMHDAMPFDPALMTSGYAWMMFIITLIVAGIMMIPLIYLYNFSEKAKKAIKCNDSLMLAQSIRSLKNLFVFYGIVMIIYIVFMIIALLVGGIAASFLGGM